MHRYVWVVCMLGIWLLAGNKVRAQGEVWESKLEETENYLDRYWLEELEFGEIQEEMEDVLRMELDFENLVVQAVDGDGILPLKSMAGQIVNEIRNQWGLQKHTFFSAVTLTVCAAFLMNFSNIFKSQQIAEIGFEITYILLFLILLKGFEAASLVTAQVLGSMGEFMQTLIPAYFLSVAMASGTVTAGVFYPFLLGVIQGIRWLVANLLLPLLNGYVVLVFVNHLTREPHLSRLSELLLKGCGWILKTMLAVVAGFHLIQGMVSPAVDALKSTAFSRVALAIPGIGNLAGSVTDVLLGSGMLIKNGIGAAGLVVLISICLVPLVHLGSWVFLLELLAAVTQPVSDKRMTGCIAGISDAGKMLLRMVFAVVVLFMLSIAVVAVSTGIRV